mmetsp:Transcript_26905/g.43730  ORF Transcript_26905/g.43730 Transcript_26905/m.43730 type:complete len:86 (-) Transcript_26905:223-480(-)
MGVIAAGVTMQAEGVAVCAPTEAMAGIPNTPENRRKGPKGLITTIDPTTVERLEQPGMANPTPHETILWDTSAEVLELWLDAAIA